MLQFKDSTIDLAKLSAGLAAFAAGAEAQAIDIAAYTGENAAANNALFVIPIVIGLLKVTDLVMTALEVQEMHELLNSDNPKDQEKGKVILATFVGVGAAGAILAKFIPGVTSIKSLISSMKQNGLAKNVGEKLDTAFEESPLITHLKNTDPAIPTASGHVNCAKVDAATCTLPLDGVVEQATAANINALRSKTQKMRADPNHDPKELAKLTSDLGIETEKLTELVIARQGLELVPGGKIKANNGIDHLYIGKDADGAVHVIVVDSKQIDGGFKLGDTNSGLQLNPDWIDNIARQLPSDSPAKQALDSAVDNGHSIHKAVAGIDHATGDFNFIPVNPPRPPLN